jgi:replicative DNA helicase Mcm
VGDPSTGKSQLLQYVSRTAPRGLFTMGRGTTAAGLTAAVMKDKDGGVSLEAGALVLSDQGICCIDELEKMRDEDRVAIHPAMEQQIVSIAKAGIVAEMNARTSILAAANPVLGRYNSYVNIAQNLSGFAVTLLNRFDLIFILRDVPDPTKDRQISDFILSIHCGEAVPAPIDPMLLRKYVAYAKRLTPKLSPEARDSIQKFYLTIRSQSNSETSPIAITNRQIEALIRLTEASARLHLRELATIEDVGVAINLTRIFLGQVGIDTETGKPDIDTLTVGKPRSTQQKLQVILQVIEALSKANPDNIAGREEIYTSLSQVGIERGEAAKLLAILVRDGTVFEPRPGTYKLTRYG